MKKQFFYQSIVINSFLLLILISSLGCKSKIDKQKDILYLENQFLTIKLEKEKKSTMDNLLKSYYNYTNEYPDDSMTNKYLNSIALMEFSAEDGNRCINALNIIISKFPNSKNHAFCMYFKGYVFEHLIHSPDSARMAYLLFIDKYPKNSRAKILYDKLFTKSQLYQTEKFIEPESDVIKVILEYDSPSNNYVPSPDEIDSLLPGKWVLDSSSFTPTMPEQKDSKYLRNLGYVRSDGQVVLFSKKLYKKKGDSYQSNEYTRDGRLIIFNIYDAGNNNSKHFNQRSEYTFVVVDSTISFSLTTDQGKSVEFKSIIRKLTRNQLIYRQEDVSSNDQIFYFSKQQ